MITESMNHKPFNRTTPATPGLVKIGDNNKKTIIYIMAKSRKPFSLQLKNPYFVIFGD